ncbi:MAG: hypothetical protein MJ078_01495 [Clostridia bacterium]|nr:hypothetical protein [Clostridia bacterium]
MSIRKISESEIQENGVSSLASRPSSHSLYGGKSLSSSELKEAFDRLPRLIAERFNALLEADGLLDTQKDALRDVIATGISAGHSLGQMMLDIQNGTFCTYLSVDGEDSLTERLADIAEACGLITGMEERLSGRMEQAEAKVEDGEQRISHIKENCEAYLSLPTAFSTPCQKEDAAPGKIIVTQITGASFQEDVPSPGRYVPIHDALCVLSVNDEIYEFPGLPTGGTLGFKEKIIWENGVYHYVRGRSVLTLTDAREVTETEDAFEVLLPDLFSGAAEGYCTHLTYGDGFTFAAGKVRFQKDALECDTGEEFAAFLAEENALGHPFTLYYPRQINFVSILDVSPSEGSVCTEGGALVLSAQDGLCFTGTYPKSLASYILDMREE